MIISYLFPHVIPNSLLFEREGVRWNPPPRREAGEGITENTPSGFGTYPQGIGTLRAEGGDAGAGSEILIAGTLDGKSTSANRGSQANETEFIVPVAYNIQQNDSGNHKRKDRPNGGMYVNETDTALTVGTTDLTAVAYGGNNTQGAIDVATACNAHGGTGRHDFESETFVARADQGGDRMDFDPHVSPTMRANTHGHPPLVGVRRLTPTECERLQGFPGGWTAGQADSARYRQLGNAVCVNVAEWIGRRIMEANNG